RGFPGRTGTEVQVTRAVRASGDGGGDRRLLESQTLLAWPSIASPTRVTPVHSYMEESIMSYAGEGRRMGLRYSRRGILRGAGVGLGAAIVGGCTTANPPAPTVAALGPAATSGAGAPGSGAPVVSPTAARQPRYGGVFRLSSG